MTTIPVSKSKSLVNIYPKVQDRNPTNSKERENVAIDYETDNIHPILLSDNYGKYLEPDEITFDNVMKFLFRHDERNIWAWNAEYEFLWTLKLVPIEVLKTVNSKNIKFEYKDYKFYCIPKKMLTIGKGKHSVHIFDLQQFYSNKSLATAYEKEFPDKKLSKRYLQTKNQRNKFTLEYYYKHKSLMQEYNRIDCVITKELADKYTRSFYKTWMFFPRKYISAGNTAEKILINNGVYIPRFHEVPYEVQEAAWSSYYGGRFEQLKKGFVGNVYLYDLNSAYPDGLKKMPDITNGRWIARKSIDHKAILGFYQIVADVNSGVHVAPFPFRTKNNLLIFPYGKFQTWVTLAELKAVSSDPRIKYTITQGFQFIPNKTCDYPFSEFITEYYNRRKQADREGNKDLAMQIKLCQNSIYGKTAEVIKTKKQMGNHFNPVFSAALTGYARAKLLEFVYEHNIESETVAFATDSIALQKHIPNIHSEELGQFKLDKHGNDGLFISNGYYHIGGKWNHRGVGFDPDKKKPIEHSKTYLDKNGMPFITVKATQLVHFKTALLRNRLTDLGKITTYDKKIRLNSDIKRFWHDHLKHLHDDKMYNSVPIDINHFAEDYSNLPEIEWDEERYRETRMIEEQTDLELKESIIQPTVKT